MSPLPPCPAKFPLPAVCAACAACAAASALAHLYVPAAGGLLFLTPLLGAAIEDGRSGWISDGWPAALASGGAVRWWFSGTAPDLLAAAGIFLFFLFLAKKGAAGSGDALLAGTAALWLPWESSLLFLWGAFVLGGLAAALLLLAGRKRLADRLPFAPFLCLAGGAAYGWGESIWRAWLALS